MTNNTSLRTVAGIGIATVSVFALAACGSSKSPSSAASGSPSAMSSKPALSISQRVAQAKVCLQAGKELQSAAPLLAQVSSKKVSPQQALTQLKPVAAKIDALAKANTALPIGGALTTLSNDIAAAQKMNLKDAATVKAEIKKLSGDAAAVLTHCAK